MSAAGMVFGFLALIWTVIVFLMLSKAESTYAFFQHNLIVVVLGYVIIVVVYATGKKIAKGL